MSVKSENTQEKKKNKLGIQEVWICPECMKNRTLNATHEKEGICSECWIKEKKKIKLKKMLYKKGWTWNQLIYNNMTLQEKIKLRLKDRWLIKEVEEYSDALFGLFIGFKINKFDSDTLKDLIDFWGFNQKYVLKRFSVHFDTKKIFKALENEDDLFAYLNHYKFQVSVGVYLHKPKDPLDCEHKFNDRKDWDKKICEKCGLFEKLD